MAHKDDSAPIRLLQLIWDHALRVTGDSWRRLNESLSNGLSLAIRSGMKFNPGDFMVISERYRPEYWMSLGTDGGEGYFNQAVINDNVSAAGAFENWKDRKPFIWNKIEASSGTRFDGPRRLFVGAWFAWKGERVSVTKFVDGKDSLRACSYVQEKDKVGSYWSRSKVLHRHLITRDELLAARKAVETDKKLRIANAEKMDDPKYLEALLWHSIGLTRANKLHAAGVTLAFWRSDSEGRPCNGGTGGPRKVGMVETKKGPLVECQKGALHATLTPQKFEGSRLWAVALYPPVIGDREKSASLKREILAEIKSFPPYEDLITPVTAAQKDDR